MKSLTKAQLKVLIKVENEYNAQRDVSCSARRVYYAENIAPLWDELNSRYEEERAGKNREDLANYQV